MITFLNCEAKISFKLNLIVKYQGKKGIETKNIEIKPNTEYKISVADNEYGLVTYNCRIVNYTVDKKRVLEVDTLKLDCSSKEQSFLKTINVSDIRYIEEYLTDGFEEIKKEIKEFK